MAPGCAGFGYARRVRDAESHTEDLIRAASARDLDLASCEAALLRSFDALRRDGLLDQVLASLAGRGDLPPRLASLLPYARVQGHAPLIIGHRGDPTSHVENTLPGIASALSQGADAVEIDITLVKSDNEAGYEIIARHDPDPGGLRSSGIYALIRNLGLEPKVYADDLFLARPTTPPLWRRSARKLSWELTLSQYREHYGYTHVKSWPLLGKRLPAEIPTLDQVAELFAGGYRDRILFLDTRIPPSSPEMLRAMADRIRSATERHALDPRNIIVGNNDSELLSGLRSSLGPSYRYTLDEMMVGPFAKAKDTSPFAKAERFGTDLGDVGHVFFGSDDELMLVLEADIPKMHAAGKQLIVWTINDERLFRKMLGIGGRHGRGGIDMVITDKPALFRDTLARLGLRPGEP